MKKGPGCYSVVPTSRTHSSAEPGCSSMLLTPSGLTIQLCLLRTHRRAAGTTSELRPSVPHLSQPTPGRVLISSKLPPLHSPHPQFPKTAHLTRLHPPPTH